MFFGSDTFFWLWGCCLRFEWAFWRVPGTGRFHSEYFDHKDEDLGSFGCSNCRQKLVWGGCPERWGCYVFILHLPCADECSCVYMYWLQYIIIVLHRYRCVLGHIMFCSISIVLLASLRFKMNYFIISIFAWLVFTENNNSYISATCAWFPTILLWASLIVEVTFGEWCSPIAMWTMKFHNISFLLACLSGRASALFKPLL